MNSQFTEWDAGGFAGRDRGSDSGLHVTDIQGVITPFIRHVSSLYPAETKVDDAHTPETLFATRTDVSDVVQP
eukprot:3706711-Prymnesium_polylepis.1